MSKHGKAPSANDNRSNVKNPNNKAYAADKANRTAQGHEHVPPPPASDSGSTSPDTGSQKK